LYGLSGTGKTSLIQCGLANRFYDIDWMSFFIRRGNNSNIIDATTKCLQILDQNSNTNIELLKKIYYRYFRPVYLIFDQLEELFIYGEKAEKIEFINFLTELKKDVHFVKIILVLREEYFVHLDDFESSIPEIFQSRVRMEPIKEDEVNDLIISLCNSLNLLIDKDSISEIIKRISIKPKGFQRDSNFELIEKKIELSYLQIYLQEILDHNKEKINAGKVLTISDLPKLGAINDVLTDYLDKCIKSVCNTVTNYNTNIEEQEIWKVIYALVSYKGTKQKKYAHEIQKIVS
jgi:hypothetical protein